MPLRAFKYAIFLCHSDRNLTASELVEELKAILTQTPNVVYETDHFQRSLLHYAARFRSVDFCKLLVEKNPRAVCNRTNNGQLPLHISCLTCNVQTAKYLFELYPESISIPDMEGRYPIHRLFLNTSPRVSEEDILELAQFLLHHDRGAVSKSGGLRRYLLHRAIMFIKSSIDIVALVYNAYSEAIFIECDGKSPLFLARHYARNDEVASFLETQLDFIRQAREDIEQDHHGNLPIHRVLQNESVPVGSVKLMLAAYPDSIFMANNLGMTPLHVACLSGNLDAVKCLVHTNEDSLQVCDGKGNSALHIACLAGKHDIINFILNQPGHGASLQNADGKLPIQMLLFEAECHRDSLEYMDSVDSLLRAYPAALLFLGMNA